MYRRVRPCAPLRPFVESFWVQERLERPFLTEVRTRVLPAGKMGILFHYQDLFVQSNEGRDEPIPRSAVTGQWSRPVEVRATGKTGILIATFYPWGAPVFLPGSMTELTDSLTDLRDVTSESAVRRLESRLQGASSTDERIRLAESFLLGSLDERRLDPIAIGSSLRLRAACGSRPVGELAADHGLSRRHWIRRFQSAVGLGPKTFARVMRFQKATALKRAGRDWGEVCLACGYYDQAHLIHEFQRFSGRSFETFAPGATPLKRCFNGSRVSLFSNTTYL